MTAGSRWRAKGGTSVYPLDLFSDCLEVGIVQLNTKDTSRKYRPVIVRGFSAKLPALALKSACFITRTLYVLVIRVTEAHAKGFDPLRRFKYSQFSIESATLQIDCDDFFVAVFFFIFFDAFFLLVMMFVSGDAVERIIFGKGEA